jgi:hypothetical protein
MIDEFEREGRLRPSPYIQTDQERLNSEYRKGISGRRAIKYDQSGFGAQPVAPGPYSEKRLGIEGLRLIVKRDREVRAGRKKRRHLGV